MEKKWQLKPEASAGFAAQHPELNEIVVRLLFQRGLMTVEEIGDFLQPDYGRLLDPFLFVDMEKAIARIMDAIGRGEKIMVYGDYDADGVCSTTVMFLLLKGLGADVEYYIPFRESEGYGLNKNIVKTIIAQHISLIVTVDCGISSADEIAELAAAGIDTIVTDHHEEPPILPPAYAIINPAVKSSGYPERRLCGCGVAFKLVTAVLAWQKRQDSPIKLPEGFEKWLLDLVAIATVGDIVPLLGENRILVKYGLVVLAKTKNAGIKKLIDSCRQRPGELNTEFIGWRLVPRINAAGRIDHASAAFFLLTSSDEAEAAKWSKMLEDNNAKRQQLTDSILKQAEAQAAEAGESKALIICGNNWPAGVIGLVAGRLCDRHRHPTLVFSHDGDKYLASGRSIPEFDITIALSQCRDLLARYGGHPQACGLTIIGDDNFNVFKEKFSAIAEEKLNGLDLTPELLIDAEIKLSQIGWQLLDELGKFEPFGQGNPKPVFLARGLNVESIQTVGADGKHLKALVSQDGDLNNMHKLIGFSFGEWCAKIKAGDRIDVVFELGVNEWNGNREFQLKVVDLRVSLP